MRARGGEAAPCADRPLPAAQAAYLRTPAVPNRNAWPHARQAFLFELPPAQAGKPAYLLLLLPLDFFSPPWLLRLLLALLLPLARSLWASLFWLLAFAPLLAASDRLLLPPEDLELRDAIEMLLRY